MAALLCAPTEHGSIRPAHLNAVATIWGMQKAMVTAAVLQNVPDPIRKAIRCMAPTRCQRENAMPTWRMRFVLNRSQSNLKEKAGEVACVGNAETRDRTGDLQIFSLTSPN